MGHKRYFTGLIIAISAALAGPAMADVKAGVDAWARGDYAAAVKEWQGPAAKGDSDALFNLAQAYKLGRGVPQDLARAEELCGIAAGSGHLQAADNYGLLLFNRGARTEAMPYIRNAASRGDPRAQYLMGLAHFNGDLAPRDWVRAYALTSLAGQAGLGQAVSALAQMDRHIPLEQRQQGVALSAQLASEADAERTQQLATLDLIAASGTAPETTLPMAGATAIGSAARPQAAVEAAQRIAADETPGSAGADYARPITPVDPDAGAKPASARSPTPSPALSEKTNSWRVQLGAFSVPENAENLWKRLRGRPELSGHSRILVRAGRLTKLQASGFASRKEANTACESLSSAGISCLPTRN